jgi:hypothetical protein
MRYLGFYPILAVALGAAAISLAAAAAPADVLAATPAAGRTWSGSLLHQADVWTDRMNEALVTASAEGLRVEVAPGRKWAIAAVPGVRLPNRVAAIRVSVHGLGGGGQWLVRVYGDLRQSGRAITFGPFQSMTGTGAFALDLDPRLLRPAQGTLLQVQLGLEGEPGAWAVFDGLEFIAGPELRPAPHIPGQRSIECVDLMPNLPQPFRMTDWRARAQAYDRFVFDFGAKGEHLPLIWLDDSRVNVDRLAFGLPSYVGDTRAGTTGHESITTMGAVLGATLAGIDKSRQEHNYVLMCEAYYNRRNGANLVLNGTNQQPGYTFWYEIWPHVVFYALADRYPGTGEMAAIQKATADRWLEACLALGGRDGGIPDFNHTSFDFAAGRPVDNGQWREPDAAAGVAWLLHQTWAKYGDPRHLEGAEGCLRFLESRPENPYYEVLLPYGAYTAARLNAELGRNYAVDRLLDWCFGISDTRGGWGVVLGNWGGYDVHGLLGSIDNRGGYAFAMNTFAQAGALLPVARYDTRYARAIGKWLLNLSNAARLFYPRELPPDHQSSAFWKDDPEGVIAYEGLRREWGGKSPYATGDPLALKWGPATDLGLYGSSYVGLLGGIVNRTNHDGILALDCLATDLGHAPAYPTFLCYNPYPDARAVRIEVGGQACDVYDAVTGQTLAAGATGPAEFALPADRAAVLVLVPANGQREVRDGHTLVNGRVIDYARPGRAAER